MRMFIILKYCFPIIILALFLSTPALVQAGCGCDKPPPPPAAVIPNVAFRGMTLSIFHDSFKPGQAWNVTFHSKDRDSFPQRLRVEQKRDLGDSTGKTLTARLTVSLPYELSVGPTSITVSRDAETFTTPENAFTVIGDPVVVAPFEEKFLVRNYRTPVSDDGVLYVSLAGLDTVCRPMKFHTFMKNSPLRFTYDDIVVLNSQGFLIESLEDTSKNHVQFTSYKGKPESDHFHYWRHSFVQYCKDHQPGGPKEIDPFDHNWHKDGTRHVDYGALIFVIAAHYDDQSFPPPGKAVFDLRVETHPEKGDPPPAKGGSGANFTETALSPP